MVATVADAVAALAERGADGAAFAGGTWIMRAPIRGEALCAYYVGIGRIPELHAVDISDHNIRIGACVSHARLVGALAEVAECAGLKAAAGGAANPAIRQMATVGGNLSAWDFPASDLPPALLCLDATIELRTPGGQERLPVDRFLDIRRGLAAGTLVTGVVIPRGTLRTGHARLPLRAAGDYPVAIVSVAAGLASDGSVEDIRIAVGSVEASARRWPELEARLRGRTLDPDTARDLAEAQLGTFAGRDSVEAPGWYRVQVLPALVRRAVAAAVE
jgi:carbon-monoxide dehydrogenase medium subunit